MDANLAQLVTTIKSTKCSICKLVVSVAPVVIASEDGLHLRCGRCEEIDCPTFSRNMFYESIAKLLTFPCGYANCDMDVPWGEVETHEKACPFRTITCPLCYMSDCEDVLEISNLLSHFEEKHSENIQHGSISHTLPIDKEIIILLKINDLQFFVCIVPLQTFISTVVFSIYPTDKYSKYNVTLRSNEDVNYLMSYENKKIVDFDVREHCFKCWIEMCTSKCHPHSEEYSSPQKLHDLCGVEGRFKTGLMLELLQHPSEIQYTINLVPNELPNQPGQELTMKELKFHSNNNLLRQNLECPVCKEYISPPIYTCNSGHTICNTCKFNVLNCPYCRVEIRDVRNYSLEDISNNVELPCHYEKEGCDFIGNVERLRTHEVDCSHKINA